MKRGRQNRRQLPVFERVFVFFNPASTHARRSERRIAELRRLYPDKVEVVETSSEGREANQKILRELATRLNKRTLVGIAAGDGTVGLVVETLTATGKHALPRSASQAPILPLWGGNANDLAYMLNGLSLGKRLSSVFRKADIVPIYPLTCTIEHHNTATTHIAACYMALGVSGRMAHTLNKRSYRAHSSWKSLGLKVVRELVYVTQTFRLARKFSYTQSGKRHHVYELLFANGSRMAKVDRLPITLSEPYFYADHLEYSTFGAVMRKFIDVARGQRRERRLHKQLHFKVHDEVWAQFDGEPELIAAGSEMAVSLHTRPFYTLASSLRPPRSARRPRRIRIFASKHKRAIKILAVIMLIVIAFHIYLSLTNPYASISIVRQPYTTTVDAEGNITVRKQFDLQVSDNPIVQALGYYKQGFLIAQNTLVGGKAVPGNTTSGIINAIHRTRFDPSKPYLISGDQFSVLYMRNLGVFYHSLLDPNTAHSQQDWQNRQRIYLQSALYALDGLSKSHSIKTTMVPIGPHSVAMVAVHPGSTGSDSVYGLFFALNQLATPSTSDDGKYQLQTVRAAQAIIRGRHNDLVTIYNRYINAVADGDTVKPHIDLSSARDGANRSQSFYDSAVLWKTRQLAQTLGLTATTPEAIEQNRQRLIAEYWGPGTGCFRDELAKSASYSSDWLIAAPMGILDYSHDYDKLASCVRYIHQQKLAEPLPIQYTHDATRAPWAVRTFASGYGSTAIWSYWGAEYLTLLAKLDAVKNSDRYRAEALAGVRNWNRAITTNHGYPETLDASGTFLRTPLYKSIRSTGWIVQLEYAQWLLDHPPARVSHAL